jgi:signal transduction histidine kinase
VVADPARLKQVLYNYLSNAIKFTPPGGRVTVRVAAEGADRFRLEVEDTGVGIRPEDIDHLFVEFQQLEASDSGHGSGASRGKKPKTQPETQAEMEQGTGLGLALTKRIVEALGGTVGVHSTLGKGSRFFAVLPRRAGAREAPAGETPPRRSPAPA